MVGTSAVEDTIGNYLRFKNGSGANAGDVAWQSADIGRYDTFTFMCATGGFAVFASLDGATYATAPLSLEDLGAASVGETFVTAGAALRIYRVRGTFALLQVQQSGATALTGMTVLASKLALQGF